jgi:Amt family ammonium transporter
MNLRSIFPTRPLAMALLVFSAFFLAYPGDTHAQEATEPPPAAPAAETIASASAIPEIAPATLVWVLVCAAMVFMMQPGFCMLELGFVRTKNCLNVAMKNVLDFCVATICFLLFGFSLMFGASANGWFAGEFVWLADYKGDHPIWVFWVFQVVFVGTAATIVSGAMAERTKFVGYLLSTAVLSAVIYPLLGHWAWGSLAGSWGVGGEQGWLEKLGFSDFAGSTVVHGIGGASALAGVLVVGSRPGRFLAKGKAKLIPGHNLPFATLGAFLLFFGWFGFNAGSALTADVSIGRITANTLLAGAAGGVAGMFSFWRMDGRPDVGTAINGLLGGLVAITACCHVVNPASALILGGIAGILASVGGVLLEKWHIDDVVGAVPVHLINGIWGTLCVAIFNENGFSVEKLGVQALGAFAIMGSAFAGAYLVFKLIDLTIGLRATDEEQEMGLDFAEHSSTAYPYFHTSD